MSTVFSKIARAQFKGDSATYKNTGIANTLNAWDRGDIRANEIVVETTQAISIENHPSDSRVKYSKDNVVQTLSATMGMGGGNCPMIMQKAEKENWIVRRLTPLECERLQGFPDNWTDCVSDTARYTALGNSVAVPCVEFIMQGIAKELNSVPTDENGRVIISI